MYPDQIINQIVNWLANEILLITVISVKNTDDPIRASNAYFFPILTIKGIHQYRALRYFLEDRFFIDMDYVECDNLINYSHTMRINKNIIINVSVLPISNVCNSSPSWLEYLNIKNVCQIKFKNEGYHHKGTIYDIQNIYSQSYIEDNKWKDTRVYPFLKKLDNIPYYHDIKMITVFGWLEDYPRDNVELIRVGERIKAELLISRFIKSFFV